MTMPIESLKAADSISRFSHSGGRLSPPKAVVMYEKFKGLKIIYYAKGRPVLCAI
jgi:hypothetical protein